MAQPVKDHKILIPTEQARHKLLKGIQDIYEAVATTYGPRGLNVQIEKSYGKFVLTRDGVSVAREVYTKHRAENMAMQLMLEASNTSNRLAGDGTTATIVLTYWLIREALKLVAAGANPMDLRDQLNNDATILLKELEAYTKPVTDGQLKQVATVSCGDPLLGTMIAEAVEHVGLDGGIIAEKAFIDGVEREYQEGYYLQEGFNGLAEGKRELINPIIVVTGKRIASNADFVELMDKIARLARVDMKAGERLNVAIIGEFEGDARNSFITNINQGNLNGVLVKSPSTGDMAIQYLEDIAIYCGAKMLTAGESIKNMDARYLGKAERVICTPYTTSIFGGIGATEDVEARVADIKERIEAEESDNLQEKFRDRIAKLQGKIAVFRIGGITETAKEELEYRIEDALQATKAALDKGVVPGGASTLLRLSESAGLSTITKSALRGVFTRLMQNANLPAEVKLDQVLNTKAPMGINLRGDTEKLVDLIKAGVLDPALVLQEVIKNATSTAGNAVTIGLMITFEDLKED